MSEFESVIVTSCYGASFWRAVTPWVAHLRAFNGSPIEVISLDGGAYEGDALDVATIYTAHRQKKPGYGDGDPLRLEQILRHLEQGRTCIQIDVDVRMKREFSSLSRLPYDFIVSRAFGFPTFAVKQLGFVGCTGFYIAKPSAQPLCTKMLLDIRERIHPHAYLDQHVLNAMLCAAADGGLQRQETIRLDGIAFALDVFEVEACRIGVLPRETIERSADANLAVFGNHHRFFLDQFLAVICPQAEEAGLSAATGV
jgi:hypothetical protein